MKDDPISPEHHIVHYVGPGKVQEGAVDGTAFILRPVDAADGLSSNWLEYFNCEKQEQIQRVRDLSRISLNKNGKYAELNVGETCEHICTEIAEFTILEDPLDADFENKQLHDGSHALLKNLPDPSQMERAQLIGDMIAEKVRILHSVPSKTPVDAPAPEQEGQN